MASTAVEADDGAAHAERVVARSGTSFYWSMRLLPPDQRAAMFAIYAFCREIDDIDAQLVRLLNARAACALAVGQEKKKAGMEVYQPGREADVLAQHDGPRTPVAAQPGPEVVDG